MHSDISAGNSDEPPSSPLNLLKQFKSAGRGFWKDVTDSDWNDWRWQLKHRITSAEQLQRYMPTLTPEEYAGAKLANHKLALAITPYFFNLIDPADENCPVRWQVIPRIEETRTASWEMSDPCGEDSHSPVPGLVHRYPHLEFLRIGSRIPVFLPQRITPQLCAMLKKYHPLFISVHSNHPRELTTEVRDALGRLADAGIPLGNQSVLLRNVNDDPTVMKAQMQKLLMCRVKPYYLYQCDLIAGSSHLRSSVRTGLEIMEQLRGHTTGYGVPQYVIDAPGGGGKVPVAPEYILSRNKDRVVIRNYEGKVFEYPEDPDGTPRTPPPVRIEEPELV